MVPTPASHFFHSRYQIDHPTHTPLGLYIHVPFCSARCHFCAFYLQIYRPINAQHYVMALKHEIAMYVRVLKLQETPISSIYFGGGTPTTLEADQLCRLSNFIRASCHVTAETEITIEAHPSSVTQSSLQRLVDTGFNRISFGVQSTNESELIQLGGQGHTDQVEIAINQARAAGFSNINIDVMYGLPDQTVETWASTLNDILTLSPQHISCYALTIEEGSRFSIDQQRGDLKECDGDTQMAMEDMTSSCLTAAGYQQYELSNFSLPEFQCHHNMQYWQGGSYLGLGPSAQSFVGLARFGNVANLAKYCEEIEANSLPIRNYELLQSDQAIRESIILGLRMIEGVPLEQIEKIDDRSNWHSHFTPTP